MKIKEIFIYIILLLISILSLFIPSIFFLLENENIFEQKYIATQEIAKLSEQNRKIELLNKIYSRYDNNRSYNVRTSDSNINVSTILEKKDNNIVVSPESEVLYNIQELTQLGIVNNKFYEDLLKEKSLVYRILDYDNSKLKYAQTKIFVNSNDFSVAIGSAEIEQETNKIITITLEKEYITSFKEIGEKYVKYLGLEQFTDWEYIDGEFKSLEGQVKIISTEGEQYVSLRIVPLNYNM